MSLERTLHAVQKQVSAYGVDRFELGIRGADGKMLLRTWEYDEILRAVKWLRFENSKGANIFIRPAEPLGTVLVDDLDQQSLSAMSRDGLPGAVIVETSPNNYQSWLRMIANPERQPLSPQLLTSAAVELAKRYRGDLNSADWRHFGRLAGFTNRKPCHSQNGQFPFVLLTQASGTVAPAGYDLLTRLGRLSLSTPQQNTKDFAQDLNRFCSQSTGNYQQRLLQISKNCSAHPWIDQPDLSRLDFMIARDMVAQGYSFCEIHTVLTQSPDLRNRKGHHLEDYIRRTIQAASTPFSPQKVKPEKQTGGGA